MTHKGREKEKGKSPVVSHSFDDPEGKVDMPPGMRVDHWKRPQDYITEKVGYCGEFEERSNCHCVTEF